MQARHTRTVGFEVRDSHGEVVCTADTRKAAKHRARVYAAYATAKGFDARGPYLVVELLERALAPFNPFSKD